MSFFTMTSGSASSSISSASSFSGTLLIFNISVYTAKTKTETTTIIIRPGIPPNTVDTIPAIARIINSLDIVFSDKNYLDLELLNFKKELKFLDELTRLKQIPDEIKIDLFNTLVNESNNVYNILEKEANKIDYTGVYGSIIRNNRIKWSE